MARNRWGLSCPAPDQTVLNVLHSEDLLGTTELAIDYVHDCKEKFGEASAKLSYKGWYPVVSIEGALRRKHKKKIAYEQKLSSSLLAVVVLSCRKRGQTQASP